MTIRWNFRLRWLAGLLGSFAGLAWLGLWLGLQRMFVVEVDVALVAIGGWLIGVLLQERRTAVSQLAVKNADLGRRVAERTNALARRIRDSSLVSGVAQALADARLDQGSTMQAIAGRLSDALGDVCIVAVMSEDG